MTSPANTSFLPPNLDVTEPDAGAAALEQASEYESLFGDTPLEIEGGTLMIPPHPDYGLLPDDRIAAYEKLEFEKDTEYERDEDIFIPEQRLRDEKGVETGVVLPATTRRGPLKSPFRKLVDGKSVLVDPPYIVQVVQAALGPATYAKLTAGGKSSKDVWKIWGEQSLKIQQRQKRDPKSVGGSVDLAAVSKTDSK